MDAVLLMLVAAILWPVIRAYADLAHAVLNRRPGKVGLVGWLLVSLVCLIGAGVCLDRRALPVSLAFIALALSRDVASRIRPLNPARESS